MKKRKLLVKKTKYFKPTISAIKLDNDQAIMAACKSGGAYFDNNIGTGHYCVFSSTVGPACATPIKGHGGKTNGAAAAFAQPS